LFSWSKSFSFDCLVSSYFTVYLETDVNFFAYLLHTFLPSHSRWYSGCYSLWKQASSSCAERTWPLM